MASWGVEDGKRDCKGAKVMRYTCAHVADEITLRVVGFVASASLLATTGRCHGRWNGRELEMTQDAPDHRLLGDGGNDPECTTPAKRTWGHIQVKYPSQQPRPLPIRCFRLRFLAVHPLLARCGTDRISKRAGWRQTPCIADEVDTWQGHSHRKFCEEIQQ